MLISKIFPIAIHTHLYLLITKANISVLQSWIWSDPPPVQNNYLCTYDLYGPVRKVFDAGG